MRKILPLLAVAASIVTSAAIATPAFAYVDDRYPTQTYVEPVAGAAVAGGVAGVGTIALIDAAVQPCAGFHALFGMNHGACVNGQYVGYDAPRHRISRR